MSGTYNWSKKRLNHQTITIIIEKTVGALYIGEKKRHARSETNTHHFQFVLFLVRKSVIRT